MTEFDSGFEAGSMAAANLILVALRGGGFAEAAQFVLTHWEADDLNTFAVPAPVADPTTLGPAKISRTEAVQQGFTGDACSTCGSMKMQVAGHCTVCAECGTTTGCS